MTSLIQKGKSTFEICWTQNTRNNIVRHEKRCSVETLYSTQCPDFSTKTHSNLKYHITKEPNAPKHDVTFKCKFGYQECPGFYALRQHKTVNTQCKWDQEQECGRGTPSGRCWASQFERRVAFLSTFLGGFWTRKSETQKIQLTNGNSQRNNRERKTWSFFQHFEMYSKSETGFWFRSEK